MRSGVRASTRGRLAEQRGRQAMPAPRAPNRALPRDGDGQPERSPARRAPTALAPGATVTLQPALPEHAPAQRTSFAPAAGVAVSARRWPEFQVGGAARRALQAGDVGGDGAGPGHGEGERRLAVEPHEPRGVLRVQPRSGVPVVVVPAGIEHLRRERPAPDGRIHEVALVVARVRGVLARAFVRRTGRHRADRVEELVRGDGSRRDADARAVVDDRDPEAGRSRSRPGRRCCRRRSARRSRRGTSSAATRSPARSSVSTMPEKRPRVGASCAPESVDRTVVMSSCVPHENVVMSFRGTRRRSPGRATRRRPARRPTASRSRRRRGCPCRRTGSGTPSAPGCRRRRWERGRPGPPRRTRRSPRPDARWRRARRSRR